MDNSAAKDPSSASGRSTTSRLLRYPLRSPANRSKEDKPPLAASSNSSVSATKRGRPASNVSQSISVLDLSGKEKSAKPPRRLSVPSKSNESPAAKSFGNITPISEARGKRPAVNQGKSDTPVSDVSKSSSRKKFSVLSSASYWLSQIKLSESAAKHSISLGFFKLALEAGCEPLQRMSDELKSYVHRHNLSELGDFVKELFEGYRISENFEPALGSGICSQVSAEGNQLSNDDVNSSSSSITDAGKLKPKSLDIINADEIHQAKEAKNETTQMSLDIINADETHQAKEAKNENTQKDVSVKNTRRSVPNAASSKFGSEVRGLSIQKKPQKTIRQEKAQNKEKVKKQGKKSASEEGPLTPPPEEEALEENKENMAASQMAEIATA